MSDIDLFVRGRGGGTSGTRRRWLGPVLAGGMLLVIGLLALQPSDTGTPYDPESPGPLGLRGLVDVLRELGVEVTVTDDPAAAEGADVVLVPPLGWPPELVDGLLAEGARVVAEAPPDDEAIPAPLGVGGIGLVDLEPDCALLADVTALRSAQWPGWIPQDTDIVLDQCIVRDDAAWLTLVDREPGELVALATMGPLVNQRLIDSDAGLAGVRLLAPTGAEQVVVLTTPPGTPPPTLFDLIDERWFDAAWLTLAVLLALALARGRRLGRPVDERLPVRVPSGELARALGDLRQRAGHAGRSAELLRERTLALARTRLGLPATTGPADVVAALEAAGHAPTTAEVAALQGRLPDDGDALVATARALAGLRQRLTTGVPARDPAADPPVRPHDSSTPTSTPHEEAP